MDYYFLILLPVIIGIGGLITYLLNGRWHQLHDKISIALLIASVVTIYATIRSLVASTCDYTYIALDNIETLTGLSLGPLFFLYVRTTLYEQKWHKWYWWLFSPAVILCVMGTILSISVGWDRILEVRQDPYAPFTPDPNDLMERLYLLVDIHLFNITMEVMAVVLFGLSICHLYRYHKRAEDYFANFEESCFYNMNYYLFFGLLFMLTTFLTTFFIRSIIDYRDDILLSMSLCLSVIYIVMLYNAYKIRMSEKQKEAMETLAEDINYDIDSAGTSAEEILGQKISSWERRKDKPFCKEGLTLVELAREFGVSRQVLSAYINTQKGMNFNLWINTLRVEESKRLLRVSSELKLGYISDICGFGIQSTFSRTFRKIEGCTPQEYRDSVIL